MKRVRWPSALRAGLTAILIAGASNPTRRSKKKTVRRRAGGFLFWQTLNLCELRNSLPRRLSERIRIFSAEKVLKLRRLRVANPLQ